MENKYNNEKEGLVKDGVKVAESPHIYSNQPVPSKFTDPLTDFGFKKLFGDEQHKEILIDFLNDILKGQKIIKDLQITNKEVLGKQIDNRAVLIDVACAGENGETFIVEVQRASQKFFNDRALYYCANIITTNAPKGKYNGVEWNYEQKEIYFVGILDFLLSNAPKQQYFHRVNLEYEGTHLKFSKKFQMTFLEVPKFSKEDNIRSGIDQWMYIFKNLKNLKEVPRFLRIPKFKKLFAASNYLNMTEAEIQIYEAELGKMWDDHAILTSAVEEGREEGKVEGREEGKVEGREEGKVEEREAIVKTMLKMGKQTIAEIATICKVSEEEVLKLKRELV